MLYLVVAKLAIEAQAFSLKMPEQFFGMFSPARSEGTAKAAKDRLEEDVRFVAKSVRDLHFHLPDSLQLTPHASLSTTSLSAPHGLELLLLSSQR